MTLIYCNWMEGKARDLILNLIIKAVEHQYRFDSQPSEVGYAELTTAIEKDWDPETWNGEAWDDAL